MARIDSTIAFRKRRVLAQKTKSELSVWSMTNCCTRDGFAGAAPDLSPQVIGTSSTIAEHRSAWRRQNWMWKEPLPTPHDRDAIDLQRVEQARVRVRLRLGRRIARQRLRR